MFLNGRMWRIAAINAAVWLSAGIAFAQSPDEVRLTPAGHELHFSFGNYTYREPGSLPISISGPKLGLGYTGTFVFGQHHSWFTQADVHGIVGSVRYQGWCSPWIIIPDSSSPNGYALDEGDASSCSESGDQDWYVEGRGLVGKDFAGRSWAISPFGGLGLRHLSNGTTGLAGFRTDEYLYVPLGATLRTPVAPGRVLRLTLEYDRLVHGWQNTRDAALGGGDAPATATTPPFSIDGFSDVSFSQSGGWAVRASAAFQFASHWLLEPYYVRWNVNASTPSNETVTFTVNGITAQEQLGFYEPTNNTSELGIGLAVRFK